MVRVMMDRNTLDGTPRIQRNQSAEEDLHEIHMDTRRTCNSPHSNWSSFYYTEVRLQDIMLLLAAIKSKNARMFMSKLIEKSLLFFF